MVPICYSCSYFSIQLHWKIDFPFPAAEAAAGSRSLVSRITSLVPSESSSLPDIDPVVTSNVLLTEKVHLKDALLHIFWSLEIF